MFLNIYELIDMIFLTLVMGYLFMDTSKKIPRDADILEKYLKSKNFDWDSFWFAASVSAPAVILHELGHKIIGISFGLVSTFHAACSSSYIAHGVFLNFYCILTIMAVALKAVNFGFIFFIPAFVSTAGATPLQNMFIALAGPMVNLLLFFIAWILIKTGNFKGNTLHYLTLAKTMNLIWFVFNILPIPGFDGFAVFSVLFHILFG